MKFLNIFTKIVSIGALIGLIYAAIIYATSLLPIPQTVAAYAPHVTCLQWNQALIKMMETGDLETFGSYMVLGAAFLGIFIAFNFLPWHYRFFFFLTGIFILSCGMGHYFDVQTLNDSEYYWHKAINMFLTGKISLLTAAYSVSILPFFVRDVYDLRKTIKSDE